MPERILKQETVAIENLKPHPSNYLEHPEDQLEHIVSSIEQHGFYRNVVIAKDNTILAGHGVIQAAKQIGMSDVSVVRLDIEPDSPQARKVLTGDNEIANLCHTNDRALAELLKEIKDNDALGLLGTGYDDQILTNLLMVTRPSSEIEDFDAAAEWVGMPEYDPGNKTQDVLLHCETEKERETLIEKLIESNIIKKPTKRGNVVQAWYPHKNRNDLESVKYKEAAK